MKYYLIGRARSDYIINYIKKNISSSFTVMSVRNISNWEVFEENSAFIICSNPLKTGKKIEDSIKKLVNNSKPKFVHVISTAIYSNFGDYYQRLKFLQFKRYIEFDIFVHGIGFTQFNFSFTNETNSIYFYYLDEFQNTKIGFVYLPPFKLFIFKLVRNILWKNYSSFYFTSLISKFFEKIIFKIFNIQLPSSCYFGIMK